MKTNILAILLVALVALSFSGVASAATQQVLVKEAWDEQVLVSEAYDEEVIVEPEYNETVFDHYLVDGAYVKLVHHEAEYKTVHHEAEYKTVTVVDQEGYNKTVEDQAAYNETVEKSHFDFNYKGTDYYGTLNAAKQILADPYVDHKGKVKYDNINANWYWEGYERLGFKVVDDVGCGVNHIWQAITSQVFHPAVTHQEWVPPVTHEEQVLVSEAWDEEVLVSEAYDERINVPYTGNGPYFGVFPDWTDINTWAQWIAAQPGSTGEGWGSWTPFYKLVNHPAVTELIHYDAVYETVHHAAEYITVEVIDPVVKPVVALVTPVAEPKTVDMEETGTDFTILYIAFGALVVGLGLAVLRRKEE